MKEPHEQGLANQFGPESCADRRKAMGEALTGEVQASHRAPKSSFCACRPCPDRGKATRSVSVINTASWLATPRSLRT